MATAESRPYRTPSAASVQTQLLVLSPVADVEQISEHWSPGDDVVVRGTASLSDEFWAETGIGRDEDVWLVAVATCAPARMRWRAESRFERDDDAWRAEVELVASGGDLAVSLTADLWVVGPGRTGSSIPSNAVHKSAKLWQLAAPVTIALEREGSDFPTSALSFSETGRRAVPWMVETVADAEPHWSISLSLRLFVNTDLEIYQQIVDGTAGESLYSAIECDIHLAVLHLLGGWRDTVDARQLIHLAEEDYRCLAALGCSIALSLGLTIDEGCRLAWEDPLALTSRSRESLNFSQWQDPK